MDHKLMGVPSTHNLLATGDRTGLCQAPEGAWPLPTQEEEETARNQRSSGRPGVLVVDDAEAVRSVLEWGLYGHGFAVWSADSGRRAQLYQDHRADVDLVLLDVSMPAWNGPMTLF